VDQVKHERRILGVLLLDELTKNVFE